MKKQQKTEQPKLPFHTVASLKDRLSWLINLRWIAAIGIIICLPVSAEMLKLNIAHPEILSIAVILLGINFICFFAVQFYPFRNEYQELNFAELQIIVDFFVISLLVHFSGGIANPFYFLYLVQVILSGILFPGIVLPYFNAILAALLLTLWTLAEYMGLTPIYTPGGEELSFPLVVLSLSAFYITDFAGIYIINNFMAGYRALKGVIDEKNQMLEQSIRDRNKAYRYAAHELKSPVVAIQSTLAVIKDLYSDELRPEIREMVLKAENRSSQILNMIKEMIQITQYNLGIEKPVLSNVDFNEWLSLILKQHVSYAVKKNMDLEFSPSEKDISVEIDKTGLEKVVSNLVSNAIRYTPSGGSVYIVSFVTENSYGFSVRDTGIGIEEDDLGKIFEEFYRGKNAKEMERFGTGLGLNLVKEIVELYSGTISVKSKAGKGSEFIVTFPLGKTGMRRKRKQEDDLVFNFE